MIAIHVHGILSVVLPRQSALAMYNCGRVIQIEKTGLPFYSNNVFIK